MSTVHVLVEEVMDESGWGYKPGWYFYDDENERHGPFATKTEAEEAFDYYFFVP
jgi:hypothetical protein